MLPLATGCGHCGALLALNNAHAAELSALEGAEFGRLVRQAFHFTRIGEADAFLLAFDQDADYRSPNFLWFRQRHARFVYVDRVVVAGPARRSGLARLLYADLFARAVAAGHDRVVCEVNIEPPNPGSASLHARLGFVAIGRAEIHAGRKTVCYLERGLGLSNGKACSW
ncbi:GNAT family N-acetyltransferase [Lichenicoccus sp.]|uniref:GNAT family N-acetyltransferase n=1 Tax=Lichenicoccus sp. TaxID=2781899 RepID=UPI003D0B82A7